MENRDDVKDKQVEDEYLEDLMDVNLEKVIKKDKKDKKWLRCSQIIVFAIGMVIDGSLIINGFIENRTLPVFAGTALMMWLIFLQFNHKKNMEHLDEIHELRMNIIDSDIRYFKAKIENATLKGEIDKLRGNSNE